MLSAKLEVFFNCYNGAFELSEVESSVCRDLVSVIMHCLLKLSMLFWHRVHSHGHKTEGL